MSLNSNTESMQELLNKANAMPTADEVYAQGFAAGRETDTTLTQSGVPADAKATGDAINALKTKPIVLVRGVHYGNDDELATLKAELGELPNGLFWGKVVG